MRLTGYKGQGGGRSRWSVIELLRHPVSSSPQACEYSGVLPLM